MNNGLTILKQNLQQCIEVGEYCVFCVTKSKFTTLKILSKILNKI